MNIDRFSINGTRLAGPFGDELPEGKGAFETFRVHGGKVFLLEEHFDRLKKSLDALGIAWDDDRPKYYAWIEDLCRDLPPDKDAFVRFSVQPGKVLIQLDYIPFFSPRSYAAAVIKDKELTPEYLAETGFRIKSLEYAKERIDTKKAAGLSEDMEGILLTPEGNIAEAQSANIIWSRAGKLFTAPLETGILAGTIRAYLMDNNRVEEALVKVPEFEAADEIILTSGASYLRPLSRINGIGKPGKDGRMFRRLYAGLTSDIEKYSKRLI